MNMSVVASGHNTNTMNTKHTPGPWHYFHGGNEWAISRDEDGKENIARVHININGISSFDPRHIESIGESEENARLIAAAPELLEALQRLIKECEWQAEIGNMNGERIEFSAARAAIAKATKP